jgi:hypothetical protein
MSDPNIKTVKVINGGANIENVPINVATESMPAKNSMLSPIVKNRRGTRKQNGGNKDMQLAASTPVINITKVDTQQNTIKGGNSASEQQQQKSNIPPGPELPVTTGGSATKVVLKSKNRTAKVLLKKKLGGATNTTMDVTTSGSTKTGGKRKVILKSITRRVKKTRHAIKHAKDLPLEKLKKVLIEKKLIKPTSKAPESILRQIYADSLIVGKKML